MKTFLSIIAFFTVTIGFSQNNPLHYLDSIELINRYTPEILMKHSIDYPIYRVYEFNDLNGDHELVLTEKPSGEKFIDSIKAFCFAIHNSERTLEWQLTDFIIHPKDGQAETSIWFWTKHLRLEDLDDNGIIDPIVVYGTSGKYGTENGRLKILIYLNGKKYGIRHQNSGMDFGRNTTVDKAFYSLSSEIQLFVHKLMQTIQNNGNVIFPAGWEENMKKQKLYFDEN